MFGLSFGSNFADIVEGTCARYTVNILLSGLILLYHGLDSHLELFAQLELHNFLFGLKLFEHMVMRRVMLMRSTQSVCLLFQNSGIIELLDLKLIVEVFLL